jgi:hypothetical protein
MPVVVGLFLVIVMRMLMDTVIGLFMGVVMD